MIAVYLLTVMGFISKATSLLLAVPLLNTTNPVRYCSRHSTCPTEYQATTSSPVHNLQAAETGKKG